MHQNGYGTPDEIRRIAESVWEEMMGFSKYAFP